MTILNDTHDKSLDNITQIDELPINAGFQNRARTLVNGGKWRGTEGVAELES